MKLLYKFFFINKMFILINLRKNVFRITLILVLTIKKIFQKYQSLLVLLTI